MATHVAGCWLIVGNTVVTGGRCYSIIERAWRFDVWNIQGRLPAGIGTLVLGFRISFCFRFMLWRPPLLQESSRESSFLKLGDNVDLDWVATVLRQIDGRL